MGHDASGPAAACEVCGAVVERAIELPRDLARAVAELRGALGAGGLVERRGSAGPLDTPFSTLVEGPPWPDVVRCAFECRRCGATLELSAETYHGSGGRLRRRERAD